MKGSLLLLLFVLFFGCVQVAVYSCRKDDLPYAGTWQFTKKINSDDLTYNTTRTLILTKDSWEEIYMIELEAGSSVSAIIGTKGNLLAAHSSITFILKELGTCVKDADDKCTEDVQWFGEGTRYWSDNIPYFKTPVRGDFTVSETILHLKRDLNKDGDVDDTGEDVEFQRLSPGDE